jgi:NAD-dependent SIR2 family protein deacetylase
MKYFELLTAVDSDVYNAFHHQVARAAKAGLVAAIVTTNFDRNFERALEAAGVAYRSLIDTGDFDAFDLPSVGGTPVIKIHGCCSAPASMVDTRKQRLKGRAKSLQSALITLLGDH